MQNAPVTELESQGLSPDAEDDRRSPLSPYHVFGRADWSVLRDGTPLAISINELNSLRSLNDPISQAEVRDIYLPTSRLLRYYVEAISGLHQATQSFLRSKEARIPFIIGIAGSVAVGKSTSARLLQKLIERWPSRPKVALVTTDGFLHPNAYLQQHGLMRRKGFPESYNTARLLTFLSDIKGGKAEVIAPVYSHLTYDIVAASEITIKRPDVLILEGLNVLQTRELPADGQAIPFVSDYFDFSIFIDAEKDLLRTWYIDRFLKLRDTAFQKPESFFHRYASIPEKDVLEIADDLWININLRNLNENILPTRPRADLILTKGSNHHIYDIKLRKL